MQLTNLSQNLSMGNFSKFSTFSKLASFYEGPIWLWRANVVIIIDKIVFSQNQIFNKKWNSYVSFFLILCFTPFVVDITVITLLLSQIYVFAHSYGVFNVSGRKWWHQQKGQHIFKIFVYKFFKTYFVPSLLQIE